MSRASFPAPNPRGFWGHLLLELDPRPKTAFALLTGLILWQMPLDLLLVLLILAGMACHVLGAFSPPNSGVWKAASFFVLGWSVLKIGLDLLAGNHLPASLVAGADLGCRLTTLLFLGFSLTLSASPRRLGIALAWFLRPLAGQRAWLAALSLSLMIHFLPLGLRTASELNRNISRRWPDCPWSSRIRLLPQALLRVLSRTTWTQTLAVAARNLDQPSAWRPERQVRAWEWLATLVPAVVLILLTLSH